MNSGTTNHHLRAIRVNRHKSDRFLETANNLTSRIFPDGFVERAATSFTSLLSEHALQPVRGDDNSHFRTPESPCLGPQQHSVEGLLKGATEFLVGTGTFTKAESDDARRISFEFPDITGLSSCGPQP
jgi:hypothetical protein